MFAFIFLLFDVSLRFGLTQEAIHGQHSSPLFWLDISQNFPKFLEVPHNISGVVGESVFLPCRIEHLGDRTVTWMRQKDLHILTVGDFTFSADDRFKVVHRDTSNWWNLRIKSVTPRDTGTYECQVNSDPKLSRKIYLDVKEFSQLDDPGIFKESGHPRTLVEIEGPPKRHIEAGSILSLKCIVRHALHSAPKDLNWLLGDILLDYNSARRGISIQTEKELTMTVSKLSVSSVTPLDSGEYICNPSDISASVKVIVHNGTKNSAVLQMGLSKAEKTQDPTHLIFSSLLWSWWMYSHQMNPVGCQEIT